jgi:sec-independent protein translocase protein TatB
MLGIGFGEMLVIAMFLLIAVGPDKLPTMIKTVAKTYRQFRRTALDLRASTGIDDLLRDEELRELAELRKQKLAAIAAMPNKPALPVKKPAAPVADESHPAELATQSGSLPPKDEDEPPIAPVPAKKAAQIGASHELEPAAKSGKRLTEEQRRMEAPPQGVDVSEAEWALGLQPHTPASSKKQLGAKPTGEL